MTRAICPLCGTDGVPHVELIGTHDERIYSTHECGNERCRLRFKVTPPTRTPPREGGA